MKVLKGIWIGFWSGLIIGGLMKWIEVMTGEKIYSLLLNVDFMPFIGDVEWSEVTEFFFHLLVSFALGILFVYIAKRRTYSFGQLTIISLVMCMPLYLLYFPLSALAIRTDLPALGNMNAFLYWVLAHFAYALLLPILYKSFERKNAASH